VTGLGGRPRGDAALTMGFAKRIFLTTLLIGTLTGALSGASPGTRAAPLFASAVAGERSTPSQEDVERQVRAAMLLNFIRFTTWRDAAFATADSDFVLAVVGEDPFGRVLEQTFGTQTIRGRKIRILRLELPDRRRFDARSDFEDALAMLRRELGAAHIAYFTGCPRERLRALLDGADLPHLLTVGDEQACAEHSTALALDRDGERVVFHANVRRIESLDLQVSSRLLSLARIVGGERSAP